MGRPQPSLRRKISDTGHVIADLIGEVDPIKVAEGRYLADETIHYGLMPRTNRGVFAINELPDLTKSSSRSVQFDGRKTRANQRLKIRLPLDVVLVASANPEDYTSRGRIITPLKDRFDVQIRTHYPKMSTRNRHHGARGPSIATQALPSSAAIHEGDPRAIKI